MNEDTKKIKTKLLVEVLKYLPQKSNCLLVSKEWKRNIELNSEFTLYFDQNKVKIFCL